MTQEAMFQQETYAATRLPLHQASPLPGWCYTSPEWYRREVETMFKRDWLCVGRAEQIAPADGLGVRCANAQSSVLVHRHVEHDCGLGESGGPQQPRRAPAVVAPKPGGGGHHQRSGSDR